MIWVEDDLLNASSSVFDIVIVVDILDRTGQNVDSSQADACGVDEGVEFHAYGKTGHDLCYRSP